MAHYIYLFKIIKLAIKYNYKKKKDIKTKVPFIMIYNLLKKNKKKNKKSCPRDIPRGPVLPVKLCAESERQVAVLDNYIKCIIIVGLWEGARLVYC